MSSLTGLYGCGLKPKFQEFTSSGTFTPSSGLLAQGGVVTVHLIGGGGNGGGASSSSGAGGGGLIALILEKLMRGGTGAENIEGVKFHEELRNFILRELRGFGRAPLPSVGIEGISQRKRIFNQRTLAAFREVRDALVLQQQER